METKANYVAVGAFTVLVFAAAFAFVYWVARVDTGRDTAPLDIIIEGSVTGLSNGSFVKFNGIDVGRITQLSFDAANPRVVIARAQTRTDLPITGSTRAVLSFTGLTGIAHIELEGGDANQPNVFEIAAENGTVASIMADPSAVNDLLATAQDIADRADSILSEVEEFVAEARAPLTRAVNNVTEVTDALAANADGIDRFLAGMGELGGSLDTLAVSLERTLGGVDRLITAIDPAEIDAIVGDVRLFAANLSESSQQFEMLMGSARQTLAGLEGIGGRIDTSFDQVDALIAAVDPEQVGAAIAGFADAGTAAGQIADDVAAVTAALDADRIEAIIGEVNAFTAILSRSSADFEAVIASARAAIAGFEGVGERIGQSLEQVDALVGAVDAERVNEAVAGFADAGASARQITDDVAGVTAALEGRDQDIDTIFANVTEMSERLNAASARVDGVLGRLDGFLGDGDAGSLFADAGETLRAFRDAANNLNGRLDTIGADLERFSDRGLRDVEALVNDARRSIVRIEQAITSLERNPQRLIFGGSDGVRRFDGRQRR